jgi:hypothetical protein
LFRSLVCSRRRRKLAGFAYLCLFHRDDFVVFEPRHAIGLFALVDAPGINFVLERGFVRGPACLEQIDFADKFRLGRIGRKPGRGFRGRVGAFVYFAFGFPERAAVVTRWLHGGGPDRCARSSDRVRRGNATPGSRHFGCATLRP